MITVIKRNGVSEPLDITRIQRYLEERISTFTKFHKVYADKKNDNYLLELISSLNEAAHFTFTQIHFFILIFAVPLEINTKQRIARTKRKQKNSRYEALLSPPCILFKFLKIELK